MESLDQKYTNLCILLGDALIKRQQSDRLINDLLLTATKIQEEFDASNQTNVQDSNGRTVHPGKRSPKTKR